MQRLRTSVSVVRGRRSRQSYSLTPRHAFNTLMDDDHSVFRTPMGHSEGDRRRSNGQWIKKIIVLLMAIMLFSQVWYYWPFLWNVSIANLINQNRAFSNDPQLQAARSAIGLIMTPDGYGTGFNIHPNGYVLTNAHVISGHNRVLIQFAPSLNFNGEVIWQDSDLDIALIAIREALLNDDSHPTVLLPVLSLTERGIAEMAHPGEKVVVIGNPLFYTDIVSTGTIEGWVKTNGHSKEVLALNVPIYQGNSGSPVFNEEGQVIAVVFAKATHRTADGEKVIGLAIPVSDFIDSLKHHLPK